MATLCFIVDLDVDAIPAPDEIHAAEERLRTYANGVVLASFETAGKSRPAETMVAGHDHRDNDPSYSLCGACKDHSDFGHF